MKRSSIALAALFMLASAGATKVRVHYDAGKDTILVRGDKGPMSWDKGASATPGADKVWTYTWPDALGEITMKPTLGPDKVSIGGVYKIAAGASADIYPFFGAPFGKVKIVPNIESTQLQNSRALRIYLPPSYDENQAKRYPVLYMHDGQNLFDAKTAAFGVEWSIDENINRLVATGVMDEVIVVGIDNTADRLSEYTACCDPKYGGGKIEPYQRFVVDTVKPYIDRTLRTLPGREHTAIMGSSLGALASLYIARHSPEAFSKAGVMSGSFWWNRKNALTEVAGHGELKIYLDAGGVNDDLEVTTAMRDTLLRQGYRADQDLLFYSDPAGAHNEKSWAARVARPLTWFFPWGSTRW